MDKRTVGIIATGASALLCGCPGLAMLCWGAIASFASQVPGSNIDINGSSDPQTALGMGIGALCLGIIFVIIPIVVGFLTLRNRQAAATTTYIPPSEPIPPAS